MTPSGADFIELFRKLLGQSFGRRQATFEDSVGEVSIAQSHDRRAEDWHSRGHQNEPGGERALANAARWPIAIRIDGDAAGAPSKLPTARITWPRRSDPASAVKSLIVSFA